MLANIVFPLLSTLRMAGVHISILRLLRLKPALQTTVTSPEFKDLRAFEDIARLLLNDSFWVYLFLMCRALYAPMRVLRLADQKVPAMDKLHYFVMQANRIMPKYLLEAEHHRNSLTEGIKSVMQETTDLASQEVESEDDDDSVDSDLEIVDGDDDDSYEGSDDETIVSTSGMPMLRLTLIMMLYSGAE